MPRSLPVFAACVLVAAMFSIPAFAGSWRQGEASLRPSRAPAPDVATRTPRAPSRARLATASRAQAPPARGPERRAGAVSLPDGAGGTYVAWGSDRDGVGDIYLLRVTSAGEVAPGWPAGGVAVCTAPGHQGDPGLFSDGASGVLVGWADSRNLPLILLGGPTDLYLQRVNSAGVPQWAANGVRILADFDFFTDDIQAEPDGTGGLVAAWSAGGPGDIYALRIDGSGTVPAGWDPAGVLVCGDPEDQYLPVVAPDGLGGCYVAWEDTRTAEFETYAQHLSATGAAQWDTDGRSITGGAQGYEPALCSDGAGGALLFWITATDIVGQRLNAAGVEQWTAGGQSVGTSSFSVVRLAALPDLAGGAYLHWADQGTNTVLTAQRVSGAGATFWAAGGVAVCAATGDRYVGDAFAAAGGGLFLYWEDSRGGSGNDLYAQRLDAGGVPQWTADGVAVCIAAGDQRPMSIAPDGAGGAVASWVDYRTLDPEPYLQRLDASGVPQLDANGKAVLLDPGIQRFPVAVPDGAGGSWIVWNQKVSRQYDIRARRLDGNGAPLTGSIAVCSAAGRQTLAGAVPDGTGGVLVAWQDDRTGGSDVYAQLLDGAGTAQWTPNGVAVCTAPGDQQEIRMVADGTGSAILAWSDRRTGDPDIYAQRLGSAGAGLWGAGGLAVCTAGSPQRSPVLVPSGAGGAVVAWMDDRSAFTPGVWAQGVSGAGAVLWTANGVKLDDVGFLAFARCLDAVPDGAGGAIVLFENQKVNQLTGAFQATEYRLSRVNASGASQWTAGGVLASNAAAWRQNARLAQDGAGGAIAAWSEARGGPHDLYAQRVNAAGALQWGVGGTSVCGASSWQWLAGLAADGAGGAVLCWTDERSGPADVYSQRINSAGTQLWLINGVIVADAALGQYEAALHTDAGAVSVLAWTDHRSGTERLLYSQKLTSLGAPQWTDDGVTSTLFSMLAAEASPERVRVTWTVSGNGPVTAHRQAAGESWRALATLLPDGSGRVTLEDREVSPGARYGYRIGSGGGGAEALSEAVWVEVPSNLALAIEGVRPQPAPGDAWLAFTLPAREPARLEVLDVAGRRVAARDLPGLGPGRHLVRLDPAALEGGVYFVRLWQGGRSVTTRVVRVP